MAMRPKEGLSESSRQSRRETGTGANASIYKSYNILDESKHCKPQQEKHWRMLRVAG
jgi:hypothetical protein